MPSDEYLIEKITASHFPLLRELYSVVFHNRPTIESIIHRFNTESLCIPVIGYVAIHKPSNTAAAYYGVFPFRAKIKNEIVLSAQSGDTMTHPDHRRKGFFLKLARLTYDDCRNAGVRILIGQPNQQSYYGLVNRLGWSNLDQVVRWDLKLKVKTFPLPKILRSFGILINPYLAYAKWILGKYLVKEPESFPNPINDFSNYGKVVRDAKYLSYKRSADKFFIRVLDTTLWIRLTDILWIGDFNCYDSISPEVLKKLRNLAFSLGYNTISFNLNGSVPLPEPLKVFRKNSQQASCFYYLDPTLDKTNFLLTAADSDTW
jgi:hypothetical protein